MARPLLFALIAISNSVFAWQLDKISAKQAWEIHEGSPEMIVAVLDSGIDSQHPELARRLVTGKDFVGTGRRNPHGTLVALAVARTAPRVRVMDVRVLDSNGSGTVERLVQGIDYAVERGARVLNLSFNTARFEPALERAIARAGARGVIVVAAAGNDANDLEIFPSYPASFQLENLMTVAAYDALDRRAPFSSFGGGSVHVGAPSDEGTSLAAPLVSAAAALLFSWDGTLSPARARERILATSDPVHYYERLHTASGGRLNLLQMLEDKRPERKKTPDDFVERGASEATAHPYEPNAKRTWRFTEPGATHVRVRFSGFDLEKGMDWVTLRDGQGRVVAKYSGTKGDFWSADALGDTLVVELRSDHAGDRYGFEITAIGYSTRN